MKILYLNVFICLKITAQPLAVVIWRAQPRFSGSPLKWALKSWKFLGHSENLEALEVFGAGGATKNLGDFRSRGPCLRSGFLRDLFLFGAAVRRTRPGTENQNLSEFIAWPYLFTGIYAVPRAATQITQKK